jgi:hypothetical protein
MGHAFSCLPFFNKRLFRYWISGMSWTVQIPLATICTTSLTFNNSTFCPHCVFMCFVWISEQTAIISLYSVNWLVFVTETECVYCAVRTECSKYSRLKGWLTVFCLCDRFSKIRIPPLTRSGVYKFLGRVSVAVWLEALPPYQPGVSGEYKIRVCCLFAVGKFSLGILKHVLDKLHFTAVSILGIATAQQRDCVLNCRT